MDVYDVKLTLVEPMLGTVTKDPAIYEAYIASKAALTDDELAEELATVEKVEERGWTGFHQLDGEPVIYNYMVRGFLKAACGALRRVDGTLSSKVRAYKKIIDGLVFIKPRRIPLNLNGGEMGVLERPLRAQTARGERIALARSDTVPAGTTLEFTIEVLGVVSEEQLREWLSYGVRVGLGQWRSASWGSFSYQMQRLTEQR